jgi:DNA-binding IclR family transcriptional regulator
MKRESRGIQSIEVGGELLRALARCGEPMMLRDLAREAGMTPAKAHPYLASFSRIGLIEQDETTGRYEIGALALELGLISLRRLSGVRIAGPKIAVLASQIGHAVSLAVWGTHGPTVVQLEEPGQPVHIVMRAGSVMALLETATGRAFAAFLPEKTIDAVRDHGVIRGNTIEGTYGKASSVFSSLEAIGVDLTDVFDVLETEAVEKFIQAWAELLESVSEELSRRP